MKLFKYLLIVIVGLLFFDFFISKAVEKIIKNRYDTTVCSTYNTQSDIAVFGASRAVHHYVPTILMDSLHMTAHNYGIDGQNIYTHYILLKLLLENTKSKPHIVILEVSAIDVNNVLKYNEEKLNIFYPYYKSEPVVKNVLDDVVNRQELWIVKTLGLYRHNSNFISYAKWILNGYPTGSSTGYIPLKNHWTAPIQYEGEQGSEVSSKKVEYIEKFINLCKNNGIKLFITVSPNYKQFPERQIWYEEIKRIALTNDIPLLYHEKDSFFLAHAEWFNEPFHLNDEGARIYTKIVSTEIKNHLNKKCQQQ